jgi:hypothetical protein
MIGIRLVLEKLLLILSAFPFITLIKNGFDVQPYFLVLLLLLSLREILRVKIVFKTHSFLYLIFYSHVAIGLCWNLFQQGYLSVSPMLGSFATLLIIPLTLFYVGRRGLINPLPIITTVVIVYFLIGVLQLIVSRDLFSQFVSRGDTSELRGVFSLASEPYELSRLMIAMMLSGLIFYDNKLSRRAVQSIVLISIASIFFISQSPAGILALLSVIILIGTGSYRKILIILIMIFLFFYLILNYYDFIIPKDTRIYEVVNLFHNNYEIFLTLGGVAGRLLNLPHSLYVGIFETYGLGVGLGFSGDANKIFYYNYFFGDFAGDLPVVLNPRAFGGVVGIFYEFGIFSLLFIAAVLLHIKYLLRGIDFSNEGRVIRLLFGLLLIFFFDGVLSNSIIFLFLYSAFYSIKYVKHLNSGGVRSLRNTWLDRYN